MRLGLRVSPDAGKACKRWLERRPSEWWDEWLELDASPLG